MSDLERVENKIDGLAGQVGNVREAVASLETTVNLLVAGKIKTNGNGNVKSKPPAWTEKATLAVIEIVRVAVYAFVGGISGYYGGKGGGQ